MLSRRDADGTSLARLAAESGIPIGTLSYWSCRRRQRLAATKPPFAEVIVSAEAETRTEVCGIDARAEGQPMFELALVNGRRVTIAAGFDAGDLRRLLAIAEGPSC